jgi:hypothetical protein
MFQINDKNIKKLERDLSEFAARALPFATRKTLNDTAFATQRIAKADVRNDLTLRNRFTEQSIQVQQERRELNIRRQQAIVGSIADYMEDQEFGATKTKGGKNGVAIPTSYAAGQEGQQPRTRLPRKANKLMNIRLRKFKGRRASNRKQQTLFKVQDAVTSGSRVVFLDLGKRQGIFRVVGGSRRFKRGWPKGARLKMLHDMTSQSVVIPRNPWLTPAVAEASRMLPAFYADALRFQLRRLGIFKG